MAAHPEGFSYSIRFYDADNPQGLELTGADFTHAQQEAMNYIIANRGVTPVPPAHRLRVTDQVAPHAPPPNRDRVATIKEARAQGFSGIFCTNCQGARTRQNGSCMVCDDCGTTTGCS
jgi:hypothetical protein